MGGLGVVCAGESRVLAPNSPLHPVIKLEAFLITGQSEPPALLNLPGDSRPSHRLLKTSFRASTDTPASIQTQTMGPTICKKGCALSSHQASKNVSSPRSSMCISKPTLASQKREAAVQACGFLQTAIVHRQSLLIFDRSHALCVDAKNYGVPVNSHARIAWLVAFLVNAKSGCLSPKLLALLLPRLFPMVRQEMTMFSRACNGLRLSSCDLMQRYRPTAIAPMAAQP